VASFWRTTSSYHSLGCITDRVVFVRFVNVIFHVK
jgi:hypothetical protein